MGTSLFDEFRRRSVVRVAIGYLASAWLLIQVLETLFPIFGLPETSIRVLVIILAIGFLPALVLAWIFEWTPEGIRRDRGPVDDAEQMSHRGFDRAIVAVLLLAVGYFAVDKFVIDPSRDAAAIQAAREAGLVEGKLGQYLDKSIVVLPFANLSPDPEQEYFADGLAEELLNLLAQMPELRVISRSTSFTFKGQDIVIPDVARKLNVSHVLEGSVRKSGDQVRVTVQLIEGRTDTHLWSNTYDREFENVFAIQDEVAAEVVSQLELHLLGQAPEQRAIDPRAYELYLQVRHMMGTPDNSRNTDRTVAKEKIDQILELEPEYLPALTELVRWHYRPDTEDGRRRARQVVSRMAAIAPDSSYANHFLGWMALEWDGDPQTAARYYERAIADNPYNPQPLLRIVARLLSRIGRSEEAEGLMQVYLARDPACTGCTTELVGIMRSAGRHREGAEILERILEWQEPNELVNWNLGVAWLFAGEPERALTYFDNLEQFDPGSADFARLFALYDLGRIDEFDAILKRLQRTEYATPSESLARIYAWTGQPDKALEMMQEFVDAEGPEVARMFTIDLYSRIADDPRYQAFLKQYGVDEKSYSHVEFNPPYPPEIRNELAKHLE